MVESKIQIYKITCIKTDRSYIGSTKGRVEDRFKQHVNLAKYTTLYKDRPLCRDINLYGAHNFIVEVLETFSDPRLRIVREQFWINEHQIQRNALVPIPRLYNIYSAVGSSLGSHVYHTKTKKIREKCACGAEYCPTNRHHHRNTKAHNHWIHNEYLHLHPSIFT